MSLLEETRISCHQKGHVLLSENLDNKKSKMFYRCACGLERSQTVSDYNKNRECRTCKKNKIQDIGVDISEIAEEKDENTGERWRRICGGWISNLGNARKVDKSPLKVSSNQRVQTGDGKRYIHILMAEVFQINGYERLSNKRYFVNIKDLQKAITLENIQIVERFQ